MKKILLMLTAISLIFIACEKDKQEANTDDQQAIVEFKIEQSNFDFKTQVPECDDDAIWSHVVFSIEDTDGNSSVYTSTINYIGEEYLTQVIKLDPGTYLLTSFMVYDTEGNIIRAAPMSSSIYYDLMTYKLDLEFTVEAFFKKQVAIDVLCYEELAYDDFGFTWFEFNDVRIERQCIFGDICVDDFAAYDGSLYQQQDMGIQFDMPAIFEIKVLKGDELLKTFSNASWFGESQCLEVFWPNRLAEIGEVFNFELWVLLATDNGLEYVLIDTWTFIDGVGAITGDDGVVDFVIGGCNLDPADYEYDLTYECYPDLTSPELVFEYSEEVELDNIVSIRYYFDVPNYVVFPDELFAPSPDLPPCGLNDNSSRSWVNIFDQDGNAMYGFCALGIAANLDNIWCSVPLANTQPTGFYIVITDRKCDISYTSEIMYIPIP